MCTALMNMRLKLQWTTLKLTMPYGARQRILLSPSLICIVRLESTSLLHTSSALTNYRTQEYNTTVGHSQHMTRKPSYRWQTRATRKHAKNCSNSTCLKRCRWQYWPIFMRLAAVASEICEIPRNSRKIQTYEVQGHPRSSILVPIESPYVTCY